MADGRQFSATPDLVMSKSGAAGEKMQCGDKLETRRARGVFRSAVSVPDCLSCISFLGIFHFRDYKYRHTRPNSHLQNCVTPCPYRVSVFWLGAIFRQDQMRWLSPSSP